MNHGKERYIDFQDDEKAKLRKYFGSLDSDGGGSIGIEELEDPLIALGLVDNRQDVEKIMASVDDDGGGEIEFEEFLGIIKSGSNSSDAPKDDDDGSTAIYNFFKDLTGGKMNIDGVEHLPFSLYICAQRRRKILQAIMPDPKAPYLQKDGERILNNYKRQIAEKLAEKQIEEDGPLSTTQAKDNKRDTMVSMKTTKSAKAQKLKDAEERRQKMIQQKMNEISNFSGDPPGEEILLGIINKKRKKK